ncbi:uncharacterized protein VNE69_07307 [Vairimorpha necatrix]|uniref:Uncharacterized protein n=1 Tax=Vairimorpha necatrix TaxID=6039 RepID=A0AAX4JE15_9MICR
MYILEIFTLFVLSKANQFLYNKIKDILTDKIESRDYVLFDHTKRYASIGIYTDHYNIGNGNILIEVTLSFDTKNNNHKNSIINCKNKTLNEIIAKIEEKIQDFVSLTNNTSLVLFYNESQLNDSISLDYSITFKNIIETIKNINCKRKINKKGWEIYYENICIESDYFDDVIRDICKNNVNVNTIKHYDYIPNYFIFGFNIKKFSYLFRLCIENFDFFNDIKIKLETKYDEKILELLLKLYKMPYDHLFQIYFYNIPINISLNSIEIRYEYVFFRIEIEQDKIIFIQNAGVYFYYLQYGKNVNFLIDKQCFIDFRKIIEVGTMITDENAIKAVILWSKLLSHEDKMFYLIDLILKTPKSAPNILLAHLLLHYNIIEESELTIITLKNEYSTSQKTRLINTILAKMSNLHNTEFFILKIALLNITEKYIDEYDKDNDLFYKTFRDIGNLILSKNNKTELEISNVEKKISMLEIMEEVVSLHIFNLKTYKNEVLNTTGKLISIFTGLKTSFLEFFDRCELERVTDEDVINSFELNINDVVNNNKILREKLIENTRDDIKLEVKRKNKEHELTKMMRIIKDSLLEKKLNQITHESRNVNIKRLFDKNKINALENNYIQKGIETIKTMFLEKFKNVQINESSLLEYKNKLIKKITGEIKSNFKKNIKEKVKLFFSKTIINLFYAELHDNLILKKKTENRLKLISLKTHKDYVLKFLNEESGSLLHNILVRFFASQAIML